MRTGPVLSLVVALSATASAGELPARYFRLLEAGSQKVDNRLKAEPGVDLAKIETAPGWRHFGYSILAPAVLYATHHPDNPRYHDPRMLALALRIGDLLASENDKGKYEPRGDSDWDTYTWLEAYRILENDLGPARRDHWKRALLANIALLEPGATERVDFAWFQSPFIGTSPNHYSQWAELLYLAGRVFDNAKWVDLGTRILHRFAKEQSPDGFWGEHTREAPTIGYDHLTLSAVAVYYEYSKDPVALEALRRSLTFHKNFTWLDGTPVETMNNRNRYWEVSSWAQFAFSHFPEGRRYAEFLSGFFDPDKLTMESIGRLAQDALYYHEGPTAPIPQDGERYAYQLSIPGGIRKTGPWMVSLSGIVESQAPINQYYLDRQANLAIYHQRTGLIVSGANSKRQPELATLRETLASGETLHLAGNTRLQMNPTADRLSLAFNTFFADLYMPPAQGQELNFKFVIAGRGEPPRAAFTTLQLVLHAGESLETANGKYVLSAEPLNLTGEQIGGWIRHHGWTLHVDPTTRLTWPIYPFNPYRNAPETTLEHAVGAVSVPLKLKSRPGHYVRPNEQEIAFKLTVE
jgi:hypothetical protein